MALAEIGDKTQLLAFLLATRYRRPWPIIGGILVATLLNHAAAGLLGAWLTSLAGPATMRWVLAVSFIAMAGWMLMPDRLDDDGSAGHDGPRWGVFGTTAVAFFMAEMGDKTQVATIALAAKVSGLADVALVVAGTTLGMMIANVPAVLLGGRIATRMPVKLVHGIAAAVFAALGVATLLGAGQRLGF